MFSHLHRKRERKLERGNLKTCALQEADLEKTPGWVRGSRTLGWVALYCMWLAMSRANPAE
jgi:hypothetical protein